MQRPRALALAAHHFTRPLVALLAVLVLSLGCSSTGSSGGKSGSSPTLARVLSSGELRVGMSGDQPPMNVRSRYDNLIGLEVDLANALAESMKVKAKIVEMPFSELLDAVNSGKVDIVLSNVTMTPERNTKTAFVGPYFVSGKAVLTKSATLAGADRPSALDDNTLSLAVLRGSTSEALVREAADDARILTATSYDAAVDMVIQDKADAMVADFPMCAVFLLRYPEAGLAAVGAPFTFEPIGAALPPGDALFANMVGNYFKLLEGTGLMETLRATWFLDGSWLSELPPVSARTAPSAGDAATP